MKVTKEECRGVLVFTLDGRFDAYRAQGLRQELLEAIDQDNGRVIVDLSKVTLVDSQGLSALVTGMKRARQKGGDLRLVGLPSSVRIVFELTRLDRAFEILDTVSAAINSFCAGPGPSNDVPASSH